MFMVCMALSHNKGTFNSTRNLHLFVPTFSSCGMHTGNLTYLKLWVCCISMGKPKGRVSLRAANQVNRNLDRLTILCIIGAVRAVNAPWGRNSVGHPCGGPKVVAVCVFLKIACGRTYDTIETYLKPNPLVAQQLELKELPGHSVIARGMSKMPMSYIRLISRLVTFQMRRRGMNVAVDSSEFRLKTSSKWFDIRIKRKSTKGV